MRRVAGGEVFCWMCPSFWPKLAPSFLRSSDQNAPPAPPINIFCCCGKKLTEVLPRPHRERPMRFWLPRRRSPVQSPHREGQGGRHAHRFSPGGAERLPVRGQPGPRPGGLAADGRGPLRPRDQARGPRGPTGGARRLAGSCGVRRQGQPGVFHDAGGRLRVAVEWGDRCRRWEFPRRTCSAGVGFVPARRAGGHGG